MNGLKGKEDTKFITDMHNNADKKVGLVPTPKLEGIEELIRDLTSQRQQLKNIGLLAIKVYIADNKREEARLARNREMFKHPCKRKTQAIKACYCTDYFLHQRPWCKNCKANQPFHEDYIFKAHQLSSLKAQLNKAIKEYTGIKDKE
jgi:ElaB/YqjD/DUF883 family membrane-anchored ribosome-binding protein